MHAREDTRTTDTHRDTLHTQSVHGDTKQIQTRHTHRDTTHSQTHTHSNM